MFDKILWKFLIKKKYVNNHFSYEVLIKKTTNYCIY